MDFHLPTTPEAWEAVNRHALSRTAPAVPPSARIIIWLVTIVGPLPALLYLISAVKACQTNGWWLVKVDDRGYLYPHNRAMLAIWINAFTIGMSCFHFFHYCINVTLKNTASFITSVGNLAIEAFSELTSLFSYAFNKSESRPFGQLIDRHSITSPSSNGDFPFGVLSPVKLFRLVEL